MREALIVSSREGHINEIASHLLWGSEKEKMIKHSPLYSRNKEWLKRMHQFLKPLGPTNSYEDIWSQGAPRKTWFDYYILGIEKLAQAARGGQEGGSRNRGSNLCQTL